MASTTTKKRVITRRRKYSDTVSMDIIQVDPLVQRMFDPNLANKIESAWDPMFAGTLVLSKRKDGSFFVIDGQHRLVVARRREQAGFEMDCEVHEDLSLADEAEMFLRHNKFRKSARPYDNFKVALTAGYPDEVRVDAEVRARGLEVSDSPSANKVGAVQALIRIAQSDVYQGGLVEDTLAVCEAAWGRDPRTWDGMVIQAVARVINKNRDTIDLTRLSRVLAKSTVDMWKAQAVATAKGGGGSVSRSNALAEIVVPNYNTRLRTDSSKIAV